MKNAYFQIDTINGRDIRPGEADVIDWPDVEDDETVEDIADEFLQYCDENPGLAGDIETMTGRMIVGDDSVCLIVKF